MSGHSQKSKLISGVVGGDENEELASAVDAREVAAGGGVEVLVEEFLQGNVGGGEG